MLGKEDTGMLAEMVEKSNKAISDVKPSSGVVQKKMVQARLPFKRLNPVPEKGEISPMKMANIQKNSHDNSEYPLDDENGCKMESSEGQAMAPKMANGSGPLDKYVKKISKACGMFPYTIDLTEDSNSELVEKLQSTDKACCNLVGILPSCDLTRSPLWAQTDKDFKDGEGLKLTASADNFNTEETTAMNKEIHSTESQSISPVDSSLTYPVKENADDDAPFSSNSSPISSDDVASTVLKQAVKSSSLTRCKEKEHQLKRLKILSEKEQRGRIREELKLSKEQAKEEAKKKKDEEREQKAKEKKEKKEKDDREKAEKIRLKEEKKKEKLEALEAKQEEKRKKEEEKRMKEEEKRIKAEKAEITRFLKKPKKSHIPKTFAQSCGKFAPFEIKKNMAVAPLCRVEFEAEDFERLDEFIKEQTLEVHYLLELKTREPRKMGRTVISKGPLMSDADDVQVVTETDTTMHESITCEPSVAEHVKFGKMKLLQFSENHRPAYWGTWNRSSTVICPRRPWAQDTTLLDYEVDSDEEWEEDEPGESLSHSEGEDDDDDDDSKEEDEEDDGFFVPHGYLSEDEGGVSDEECKNPENQKVQQRLKAKEWDELQSKGKKINVLRPILIGCVWLGCSTSEMYFLQKFSTCYLDTVIPMEEEMLQECNPSQRLEDREILAHLLPLLHGNVNGSKIIIQEFQECCRRGIVSLTDGSNSTFTESTSPNAFHQIPGTIIIPSKARLKRIISENSVYEKRPDHRLCWYVHNEVLKSFQQESLPVPCQWTYVTQVNLPNRDEIINAGGQLQTTPSSGKRKSSGSMPITKFMKKATVAGAFTNITLTEADGFQADTEEDDDDDEDDCMIVEEQLKRDTDSPILCTMQVTSSEQPKPEISRESN